jgi:hypothetical protein
MTDYRIREATLDDVDVLVHHRIAMFTDMGSPMDAQAVSLALRIGSQECCLQARFGRGS